MREETLPAEAIERWGPQVDRAKFKYGIDTMTAEEKRVYEKNRKQLFWLSKKNERKRTY